MFTTLANPARFMRFTGPLIPICAILALALLPLGLWLGLVVAPPEQDQGDSVRIMFVHVPAAWLAIGCYAFMGGASFVYFVWRHNLADVAARAAAPLGAACALLTLVTGAIWGAPGWGTWWAWDARLASTLVLFLIYLGYMALRGAFDDERTAARAAAILCMVGLVNLPIIRFSVDWWVTLHQSASTFRADGGDGLPDVYWWPLGVMALAFTFGFAALLLARIRAVITAQRARAVEQALEAAT